MLSLTYFSTAVEEFDDAQLEELLADSRSRNHAAGLTGRLLYSGGHFVQTLEGPTEVVDAAYERIAADSRHRDVFVTLREEVAERSYPEWAMGFEPLDEGHAGDLPGFDDYLTRDASGHQGTARAEVFHRAFRDNMR